jgi:hypothetical protein
MLATLKNWGVKQEHEGDKRYIRSNRKKMNSENIGRDIEDGFEEIKKSRKELI